MSVKNRHTNEHTFEYYYKKVETTPNNNITLFLYNFLLISNKYIYIIIFFLLKNCLFLKVEIHFLNFFQKSVDKHGMCMVPFKQVEKTLNYNHKKYFKI